MRSTVSIEANNFRGVGELSDQHFIARNNRPRRPASGCTVLALAGRPPLLPDQWDEANVGDILAEIFVGRNPDDPDQFLATLVRADRNHQPAADLQLLLERLRNLRPAGGHDNGIVRSMLGPPSGAVAMQDMDIVVAEFGQFCRGLVRELAETLDRVHIGGDFREHCGSVAGAGADLENLLASLQHQGFGHEGDDIGLGNRLLAGDRERRILVGEFAKLFGEEAFARYLAHGFQHQFVAHTAPRDISLDHFRTQRGKRFQLTGTDSFRRRRSHDDGSHISTIPINAGERVAA